MDDDDDLLREVLLRLPPQPSSLPRASAVCKRWRLLVSDPQFKRRFRIHHRGNPPLLGLFVNSFRSITFVPTMEAPNRVSPERLSSQFGDGRLVQPLGCRHGLALMSDKWQQKFLVCDPITGDQHELAIPIPPGFDPETTALVHGAVLRPTAGDVHFQVVFVATSERQALACVYSSDTSLWGHLVSAAITSEVKNIYPNTYFMQPAVLVGDSLYWSLPSNLQPHEILEFDLKRQSLAVIPMPVDSMFKFRADICTVMRAEGGGVGLLSISNFTAQLWKRKTDCDGVGSWVLGRTIELDKLLSLNGGNAMNLPFIRGFAENNNVVFVGTDMGVFMVHLESLKFKSLFEPNILPYCHPFECVYTAEAGMGGGHDAVDLLHNT